MTETESPLDEIPAEEPDHNLGYLGEIKIHQNAEDVVTLRFIARDTGETVDIRVTDNSMVSLVKASEAVFRRVHDRTTYLRDLFDSESN